MSSEGIVERIDEIVGRLKTLEEGGRRWNVAMGELLSVMRPGMKRLARKYEALRGSLSEEDLLQVGSLAAARAVSTFDESKGSTFCDWSYFRINRAMKDLVLHGSADVHVGEAGSGSGAERRRRRIEEAPSVTSLSRDAAWKDTAGAQSWRDDSIVGVWEPDSTRLKPSHEETPEALLSAMQQKHAIRRHVNQLSPEKRNLVARIFGVGQPAESMREVARRTGQPRTKLDELLKAALADLQAAMRKDR